MTKSFREGFFGALAYGAGMLAVVPLAISLVFIWAAVGSERFNRNATLLTKALEDAKRSLDAAVASRAS